MWVECADLKYHRLERPFIPTVDRSGGPQAVLRVNEQISAVTRIGGCRYSGGGPPPIGSPMAFGRRGLFPPRLSFGLAFNG